MTEACILEELKTDYSHTLPIYFPPPIVTYLSFPFQLSILLAYKKTEAWYYSNYIQLFSKLNSNPMLLLHFFPDEYLSSHTQYFIDIIKIDESIYRINKKNLVNNICKWIDNKLYVKIILSESELPGMALYGKELSPHPQFIFGYDKKKETFMITNFNYQHQYSIIDVNFSDLTAAFFSKASAKAMVIYNSWGQELQAKHPVILYKFRGRDSFFYHLDIGIMIELFEDYIYSRNSSYHYKLITPRITEYEGSQWGISVYKNLIEYLKNIDNGLIDFRAFHGIWEHKKIMISRIKYLISNNYLEPGDKSLSDFIKIEKDANQVRLLIFRYNSKKKSSIISTVSKILQNISDEEFQTLNNVCKILKQNKAKMEYISS
jgi:hypothetical protein